MKYFKRISGLMILSIALALLCLSCASNQSVRFQSAPATDDSLVLKGNLYKPEGNGPFQAIIVLHGCAGIDYHFTAWAEQLVECGNVALIVDSFSPRGINRVCGNPDRVFPIEGALDAYGAAQYLKQLPYVDSDNIGLIGFSHGGWTGLRAVQKDFVQAVKMETFPFKAAVLFYPWCDAIQDQDIDIPILILIGSKDDWTPANRCLKFKKHLSNPDMVELIVFEGATHDFDRSKINM